MKTKEATSRRMDSADFFGWGRRRGRWAAGVITLICGAAFVGCAQVSVKKVPTPTQYVRWTDAMQSRADKMEGLRFYLPRPFVSVFESFPIRTDVFICDGEVSPDGKYVIIKRIRSDSGMAPYMASDLTGVQVPARAIRRGPGVAPQAGEEGTAAAPGAEELARRLAETTSVGVGGPSPEPAPTESPDRQVEITGRSARAMTNDNSAFAFQPLRGNFDILYLPDFEEQYVVSSHAGLGNAQFAMNMGQGWSLQGFNSLEDNSALTKRVFDLIDTAMKLAKSAAGAGLEGLLPGLTPGATGLIKPQAGEELQPGATPGTPVSVKVVIVHYAAKGLYPVIKPRELEERLLSETKSFCILDLFRLFPKPTMASEQDPKSIESAHKEIENETGKFTVPRYPYQYVSFNTFRYMALEILKPDGAPFGTLYDRTGVTGEVGAAQGADLGDAIEEIARRLANAYRPRTETPTLPPTTGADDPLALIADATEGQSFTVNGVTFAVKDAAAKNKKIEVTLEATGTATADITDDALRKGLYENVIVIVATSVTPNPPSKEMVVIANLIDLQPKLRKPS